MREIKIFENQGGIRIRFRYGGRLYNLTPVPNGRYDDPDDRAAAEVVARQIAADIHLGQFDASLVRYGGAVRKIRRELAEGQKRLGELADKQARADVKQIWELYRTFKAPQLAPTTLAIDYGRRMKVLESLPTLLLAEAPVIRDWLIANRAPSEARRVLSQLSAACSWAIESGLIETNPFQGMAQRIHRRPDDDGEINPFTAPERDAIIAAFQSHYYFAFYAPLVEFMFLVGCRPSEALGLEWRDLKLPRLTFCRTWSEGVLSPRLKTQKQRQIILPPRVIALLQEKARTGLIVFPAPEGGRIDWHNFANRAWRGVLEELPEISYRNPKQMRHTFISLQIGAGVAPADVAKYCGNSAGTIYKNYLGASREFIPR